VRLARAERGARPERPEPTAETERERIRRGILYCLAVFAGLRIGLFVLGLVSLWLVPPLKAVSVPGWPAHPIEPGFSNLFTAWERFDGLWFLRIGTQGYFDAHGPVPGGAAFFPLFPLTIRALSFALGGHPFAASLLISNAAFLGGIVALYFLAASELSEPAARRAVLYLALFPTSFFFLAPYSESLFLLLSVTAFWAARRDRWWLAGLCGALAAGTRSIGIILAPALAAEAWLQRDGDGVRGLLRRLGWSALVPAGTLAYLAYWRAEAGDWLYPLHQQANWLRVASAPWNTLWRATQDAVDFVGRKNGGYWAIDWLLVVPVLALAVYATFRIRPSYSIYLWIGLLVPLFFIFAPRPLMSMPRFAVVLFPAFLALADAVERRRIPHNLVVAAFSAGLGLLTMLFVNWYYIF
jgi:hypothetical protein